MEQITYFDLDSMRNVDINSVDPDILVDIQDSEIKTAMPPLERVLDYIEQVKNPYCFRHGKLTLKVEFPKTDVTLEDCMEGIIRASCGAS